MHHEGKLSDGSPYSMSVNPDGKSWRASGTVTIIDVDGKERLKSFTARGPSREAAETKWMEAATRASWN